jgi:hypothetical protein
VSGVALGADLVLPFMGFAALTGFIVGTFVGYRDKQQGRKAVAMVRFWLVRFRPALNGWLAMHPVGCDRCDAELFEMESALAEWDERVLPDYLDGGDSG